MATTQAQAPTLHNAGTTPRVPHKLFVNIPVRDLQRSVDFFEALDFTFNQQFTDATATCMLVGEDAYCMLLTHEKFSSFVDRSICDTQKATSAILTVSVDSREEVGAMVNKAVAAGGMKAREPEDHGFMYEWGFYDLEGNPWGVFWMDPSVVVG